MASSAISRRGRAAMARASSILRSSTCESWLARVSALAGWIDDTMGKAAVEEAARETAKPVAAGGRP